MSDTELEHIGYEWRAFPAREQPLKAVIGGVVIMMLAAAAATLGQSPIWAWLAIVVLLAALNRFYLPSRFVVMSVGIRAEYPLSRRFVRWSDVRQFASDRDGGFISTRARGSMLENRAGIHLIFGPQRDEAIRAIRSHLGTAAAEPGTLQEGTP